MHLIRLMNGNLETCQVLWGPTAAHTPAMQPCLEISMGKRQQAAWAAVVTSEESYLEVE